MNFRCLSCKAIYLRIAALPSERVREVIGICEPCGRVRLDEEHYEQAVENAIATGERERPR